MTDVPVHQEILFLDDFLHQNSDSVHWDHIKFNHPVYLEQIRIIPKNYRISLTNGHTHNGSTNPKKFQLEFYANNLNKKDQECATLDKIGSIFYDDSEQSSANDPTDQTKQNDLLSNYVLKPQSIPMDWLVIVGSYLSLSIAVIGVKAKQSIPQSPVPRVMPNFLSHQNSIPLLPTPINHLPTTTNQVTTPQPVLMQSTSSTPMTNQSPNRPHHYHQPIRFSQMQNMQQQQQSRASNNQNSIRHHPYVRPQQFNQIPQPQLLQQQKSMTSPNVSVNDQIKLEPSNTNDQDQDQQQQSTDEEENTNDEQQSDTTIAPSSQSQLESQLVKHYLDLDEQKDEADLISNTNSILVAINNTSPKKADKKDDLDEYLSQTFDPFSFRINLDDRKNKFQTSIYIETDETDIDNIETLYDSLTTKSQSLKDINLIVNLIKKSLSTTSNLKDLNLTIKIVNYLCRDNQNNDQIDSILKSLIDLNIHKTLTDQIRDLNEFYKLKLLNCLNLTLNSKYSIEHFIKHDTYTQLVELFSKNNESKLSSRLSFAISSILGKITFYESLQLFSSKCKLKFLNSTNDEPDYDLKFLNDICKLYETVLVYLYRTLKLASDENLANDEFNQVPLQELFDSSRTSSGQIYQQLLSLIDESDFLKYTILIWSYLFDNLAHFSLTSLVTLNNLIETFLSDFILPSDLNRYTYSGIEFMYKKKPELTNCYFEILLANDSHKPSFELEALITKKSDLNSIKFYSLSILKLSYSIYVLDSIDQLGQSVKFIKSNEGSMRTLELLKSVDLVQSIDFLVSIDSKFISPTKTVPSYLVDLLSQPNGNMSNRYFKILLEWFEFLIEDFLYLKNDSDTSSTGTTADENLIASLRCYLLNSITNIFYTMSKLNKNWCLNIQTSSQLNEIKFLNKSCSNLINYLIITKLKPSALKNQSYFVLIEKLNTIISILEPFIGSFKEKLELTNNTSSFKDQKQLVNLVLKSSTESIRSSYLNAIVDSFRENIDKNLNLFFFKLSTFKLKHNLSSQNLTNQIAASSSSTSLTSSLVAPSFTAVKFKINCLNSNITQLRLIKNLLLPIKSSSKFFSSIKGFDLNVKLMKKIYLGHLINRNMIHVIANFLVRLNDYLLFYHAKLIDLPSLNMLEQLFNLLEPACYILKINLFNLINLRNEHFKDFYVLTVLFEFYSLFNYIYQQNLNQIRSQLTRLSSKQKFDFKKNFSIKSSKILFAHLNTEFGRINRYLLDTFILYSQNLKEKFYDELSKFIIKMPFNFLYGLTILTQCLPLPLPIPISVCSQDMSDLSVQNDRNDRLKLGNILNPLFSCEPNGFLIEEEDGSQLNKSYFVDMLRQIALTSSKSKLNGLFMRVCIQLVDVSRQTCSNVLKVFLDYSIELLTKIKFNYNLVEIESDKQEVTSDETTNMDNGCETDDSLYDTNLVENEMETTSGCLVVDGTKSEPNDDNLKIAQSTDPTETSPNDVFKSSLITNFSRLIKFMINLLNYERKIHINPIQIEFLNLIKPNNITPEHQTTSTLKPYIDYSVCLYNFLKYFNQIDLNMDTTTKSSLKASKEDFFKIQESILSLIEYLLTHLPDLFLNQIKTSDFILNPDDNSNKQEDETTCINLNDYLIKILIEHLSLTKLESVNVTSSVLSCLILLNKLFMIYYEKNVKQNSSSLQQSLMFPFVKYHLKGKYSNYLTSLINELVAMLTTSKNRQQTTILSQIDLLNKLFIYLNQLAQNLFDLNKLNKLTELLKWSEKNSNDVLIDTISTSNPFSSNNQHVLINLEQKIEQMRSSVPKLDLKKLNYLINQSKRFLKLLNDFEFKSNDADQAYKFSINLNESLCSLTTFDLDEFYSKRDVYKKCSSKDELSKYESEWTCESFNYLAECFYSSSEDNLEQINFDEFLLKPGVNFIESTLMSDKDLFKKLQLNLEEHQQQGQSQYIETIDLTTTVSTINDKNVKSEDDNSKVLKIKNQDVINTRTGIRYKAPMRGGHSSQTGRVINPTLNLSTSASASSLPLLANPTQTNSGGLIRHDPFRTRPPNTSRPPSLHVDDFYRREQQQKQLNNNSNNNNTSTNQSVNETSSNDISLNTSQLSCNNSLNEFNNNSNNVTVGLNELNKTPLGGSAPNLMFMVNQPPYQQNKPTLNNSLSNTSNNSNGNLSGYQENDMLNLSSNSMNGNDLKQQQPQQQQSLLSPPINHQLNENNNSSNSSNNNLIMINSIGNNNPNMINKNRITPNQNYSINQMNNTNNPNNFQNVLPSINQNLNLGNPNQFMTQQQQQQQIPQPLIKTSPNSNQNPTNSYPNQFQISLQNNNNPNMLDPNLQPRFNRPINQISQYDRNNSINQYSQMNSNPNLNQYNQPPPLNINEPTFMPTNNDNINLLHINPINKSPGQNQYHHQHSHPHQQQPQLSPIQIQTNQSQSTQSQQQIPPLLPQNNQFFPPNNNFRFQQPNQLRGGMHNNRGGIRRMPNPNQNNNNMLNNNNNNSNNGNFIRPPYQR